MKEINKEEFKKEIEDYVKVLFRKTIKEADQQQLFQAVSYAVKDLLLTSGWQRTRHTKRRMSRLYTICLWNF